jgi:ankyrin repeat protein
MPDKKMTFLQACWEGDLAEVTRQLDAGARINQLGKRDNLGGVHIAIIERNLPLLKLLVERGAATFTLGEKSFDKSRNTVRLAVEEGFIDAFEYLVGEKGRSVQQEHNEDPALLLFSAVENSRADNILMLRHLVEARNLDPTKAVLPDGYTLLHALETNNDSTGMVEYVLDKGVNPNIEWVEDEDYEREPELEQEYQEESPPDFELDEAGKPDPVTEDDEPEELAGRAYSGDEDDDEDEDFDDDDDFDMFEAIEGFPLNMAANNGSRERVILYLRHKANPKNENVHGKTALDAVSEEDPAYEFLQEQFSQIKTLLEGAIEEKIIPKDHRRKLLRACQLGDLATAERLLESHKDDPDYVNRVDEWDTSAVHIAMKTRNLDLLKLLVKYNADVYQLRSYNKNLGNLPVETAAANGFLEGIKFLVEEKGLKLWPVKDRPAEDLLFSAGTLQVLKYLVEKQNLDPHKALRENGEDLLLAFEMGQNPLPMIEYILNHGVDLSEEHDYKPVHVDGDPEEDTVDMFGNDLPSAEMKKEYGGLPLVRVAFNANAPLVDLYLRYQADPMQRNNGGEGNSAIDALCETSNPQREFNKAAYRQIGKMLNKALAGGYGEPQPPAPSPQP